MKLYTNNKGEWAGTQADARKRFKNDMRIIEVPTDKPSLLAFLNENQVGSFDALGSKPADNQLSDMMGGNPLDSFPDAPLKFKMSHGPDGDVRLSRQNPDSHPHRWDTIRECAEKASFKDLGVALAVLMNRLDEVADQIS
jgi:hypothetical protein